MPPKARLAMAHVTGGRRALALALAACAATPAIAAPPPPEQVEWAQDYAAPVRIAVSRSNVPLLSVETLAATERAVEDLQAIAARGGWERIQGAEALRLGQKSPQVDVLRRRLAASGDIDGAVGTAGSAQVYDSYVQAAVRRFQARHGLGQTGAMSPATQAAMNVPAETRLAQLRINVVRLRSYASLDTGRRHVVVNLPSATVETVENGVVATRHAAGVGKVDRQSPVMNAKVTEVNLNPYWHVPASIIRKDLIPKMQKDPGYLTDNKIKAYDGEREVDPRAIDWNSDEATRYKFRQEPGADVNSMGFVRVNIPNPDGVYMHDTPSKGVFGDDFRFVSSGCVRVQNVRGYVAWLLRETPGWDEARIEQAIASGERVDAKLATPVPVYWTYFTAWGTQDGGAQFRDDIYGKDAASTSFRPDGQPQPAAQAAQVPPPPARSGSAWRPATAGAPAPSAAARPTPRQADRTATSVQAAPPQASAAARPSGPNPGIVFVPLAPRADAARETAPLPPGDVGPDGDE